MERSRSPGEKIALLLECQEEKVAVVSSEYSNKKRRKRFH
jgi:hypothetical protein